MQSSPHAKATMCKLIAAGLVMFASSLSRSPRLILGCTGRRYDAKQRKLAFYSFSKVHRLASRVCSNDLNKPISDAAYVVKLQHHMHALNAPCFEHIICIQSLKSVPGSVKPESILSSSEGLAAVESAGLVVESK